MTAIFSAGTTLPVIFEDDSFLVFDKPPGMVVNRAQSVKVKTVADFVEEKCCLRIDSADQSDLNREFTSRSGIVHRLDKDTSGVLVVAKTSTAFGKLKAQFMERYVKKTYLAICHGELSPAEGTVSAPVGRLPWNRERFGVIPDGRDAETDYRMLTVFPLSGEKVSLVLAFPKTGRTHQIRVHFKHLGHPLYGDAFYAGRKTAKADLRRVTRIMLHAYRLEMAHPLSLLPVAYTAPIPDDMKRVIPPETFITINESDFTHVYR